MVHSMFRGMYCLKTSLLSRETSHPSRYKLDTSWHKLGDQVINKWPNFVKPVTVWVIWHKLEYYQQNAQTIKWLGSGFKAVLNTEPFSKALVSR